MGTSEIVKGSIVRIQPGLELEPEQIYEVVSVYSEMVEIHYKPQGKPPEAIFPRTPGYPTSRYHFLSSVEVIASSINKIKIEDAGWIISLAEPGLRERLVKKFKNQSLPWWKRVYLKIYDSYDSIFSRKPG